MDEAAARLTLNTSPLQSWLVGPRMAVDKIKLWLNVLISRSCCGNQQSNEIQVVDVETNWGITSGIHYCVWRRSLSLVVNTVIMLVFFTALQMESCTLAQSVISKEMNPSFTRVWAKELLWKPKTHSTGFKVECLGWKAMFFIICLCDKYIYFDIPSYIKWMTFWNCCVRYAVWE